jgi:hypothetical protein
MIENMKESQIPADTATEFFTDEDIKKLYEEVELKYGPGFAQYYVDALPEGQESPKNRIHKNQHMIALVRLTSHLHALSQVCSADFFQTWGAEDKVFYMSVLADVSNDLFQALHGSVKEIKAGHGKALLGEV